LSDVQTEADLRKDNYLYQGRLVWKKQKYTPLLRMLADWKCKEKTKTAREKNQAMPECWNSFTGELDRLYQTRQNIIYTYKCTVKAENA
jgi:hypothetical protein